MEVPLTRSLNTTEPFLVRQRLSMPLEGARLPTHLQPVAETVGCISTLCPTNQRRVLRDALQPPTMTRLPGHLTVARLLQETSPGFEKTRSEHLQWPLLLQEQANLDNSVLVFAWVDETSTILFLIWPTIPPPTLAARNLVKPFNEVDSSGCLLRVATVCHCHTA